jgi:hypothetical protein
MRDFVPLIICTVCLGVGILIGHLDINPDHRIIVTVPGSEETVTIRKMERSWHPTYEKDKVTIHFSWTEDDPLKCGEEEAAGCAWIIEGDEPCKILMNPIEDVPTVGQLTILGHETLHCIRGRWHDK